MIDQGINDMPEDAFQQWLSTQGINHEIVVEDVYETLDEIADDIDDVRMETDYDTPNDPVVMGLCNIMKKLERTIANGSYLKQDGRE